MLENFWRTNQPLIEKALRKYLSKDSAPTLLYRAMYYSVFNGGKRLRPLLVLAAAEVCNGKLENVLPVACALELIHTFSLIHDDLPALDNDDYRRGKLSCHKKFGEAMAILAGDALLMKAFELIVSKCPRKVKPEILDKVIKEIAKNCGMEGMVGGQVMDISVNRQLPITNYKLKNIYTKKTAALIKTCLKVGALLSEAKPEQISTLEDYGKKIGLAFQISDDWVDYKQEKKLNKLTYPQIYGVNHAKKYVEQLVEEAKKKLNIFGSKAKVLKEFADYIATRKI